MIKEIFDKYFGKLKNQDKLSNKKIIEYLVLIAVLGIIVVVMANGLWGSDSKTTKKLIDTPRETKLQDAAELNWGLEKKIAQILSEIQGVGRVSVLVTYSSGEESVPARDSKDNQTDTTEKDSGGGERKIIQKEQDDKLVLVEEQSGIKKPVMVKQLASRVMGVVVAAEGGDNVIVKSNIVRAVEAVTAIPGYRVQVFKKQG